jgi:hypothetical protein
MYLSILSHWQLNCLLVFIESAFTHHVPPCCSVPYSALAKTFDALEDTTKRYAAGKGHWLHWISSILVQDL